MQSSKVSVVLSALDRKIDLFKKTWDSILKQDYDNFEVCLVVVYQDGATERMISASQPPTFPLNIQVCHCPENVVHGRSTHNNMALDMATGEINYVTQDDMILPPNMLSSHAAWHARYEHPIAVYNKIRGAFSPDDQAAEDEIWDKLMDSKRTPIRDRWKYGGGHSFSYPANINVRMREEYNGRYGWEDIDFGWQMHKFGVWFYFDKDVMPVHQPHGGSAWDRRDKGKDVFLKWLSERSINRQIFQELNGFCPEYGTWNE